MGNKTKVQVFLDYTCVEYIDLEISKYALDGIELNRSQAINMVVCKANIQSMLDIRGVNEK